MPNYLRNFILFIFCITIFIQKSGATHILGAELFYTWNGGTKYTITVYAYRDCNGIPISGGVIDAVDQYKDVSMGGNKCCGKDITPACAKSCDRCSDLSCDFAFGIQKWIITADIDVSQFKDCNLQFRYTDGTASSTSNVSNYQANVYVEVYLNRCHADHSSPLFEFNPRTTLCVKQTVDEYITAISATKEDSISYKLAEPQIKSGSALSYNSGFSYLSPLSYKGSPSYSKDKPAGFHYDGKTGEFFFIPTKLESSFMQFEADQYLKDSSGNYYHAGETVRLIAMTIIDCNANHLPTVSHTDISSSDTLVTCSNLPIKFTISSSDSDSKSSTTLSVQDETGGKTSISGSTYQSASYSWTPKAKDVRKAPYAVTFTATDNACPVPGISQRRIYILVKDSLPTTAIKLTDSGCGRYHVGLFPIPDKNYNLAYQWYYDTSFISKSADFSYKNTQAGKHFFSLVITNKNSGCAEPLTDTIFYDTAFHKLNKEYKICLGDVVQLNSGKGSNISWSPVKGLSNPKIENPIAKPDTTTQYSTSGTDNNNCAYTDQTKIFVSDFKITKSTIKPICDGSQIKIYIKHIPGAIFHWTASDSTKIPDGDTVVAIPHHNTTYIATVNLNGCIKTDSFNVIVNQTHFSLWPDKNICPNDTLILKATGGSSYKWYIGTKPGNIIGTDSILNFTSTNTIYTGVPVNVLVADKKTGCMDTGKIQVYIHPFYPVWTLKSGDICKKTLLTYTASGGTDYSWNVSTLGAISGQTVSFTPTNATKVSLKITNAYGCVRNLHVLTMPPVATTYPTQTICLGDTARYNLTGGSSYLWWPPSGISNISSPTLITSPKSNTKYLPTITDSETNCKRTDTLLVIVAKDCIWPGDANKDKTADYLDVLNLGVGYGTKGPARDAGTIKWKRYPAANWNDTMTNGINYKHLDCNGDGVIDAKDTMIINTNYGLKHTKWTPGSGNANDPPVYFKFAKDTFYAGDTAMAYLYAGSSTKPLKGVYGIGYQATWSGTPIIANSANLAPFCDYFCSGNELNYLRPDYINNHIDAVTVETNSVNTSNTMGKIASIRFVTLDSLAHSYPIKGEKVYARLLSATVIDNTGKELNVYGMDDSAVVVKGKSKKGHVGILPTIPTAGINIYPNPASNHIIVESGSFLINEVTINNGLGICVTQVRNLQPKYNTIDISGLAPGIYFITLKTDNNNIIRKLMIGR